MQMHDACSSGARSFPAVLMAGAVAGTLWHLHKLIICDTSRPIYEGCVYHSAEHPHVLMNCAAAHAIQVD